MPIFGVPATVINLATFSSWRFCTAAVDAPEASAASTIFTASSWFFSAYSQPFIDAATNLPMRATKAGSLSLGASAYRPSSSVATPWSS